MYVKVLKNQTTSPVSLVVRCPHCRKEGVFQSPRDDLQINSSTTIGARGCPNEECRGLVFAIFQNGRVVRTYPAERLDFNDSGIPVEIVKNVVEVITCHAEECYVAAAIMIRRCLEFLCEANGAHGANLKERIGNLVTKIIAPKELLDALDKLRLLGNDAAHVEAKVFAEIGKEHVEVAMDLLKELLKATYQYKDLLDRLSSLEKPSN